jgi:hypothetical protein
MRRALNRITSHVHLHAFIFSALAIKIQKGLRMEASSGDQCGKTLHMAVEMTAYIAKLEVSSRNRHMAY